MVNSKWSNGKWSNGKWFAVLLFASLLFSCSSDDNDDELKSTHPTFVAAERPNWQIDWSSNAARPNWQEPDPTKFECSMDLMVTLNDDFTPYSSDDDLMGVFINDECRCVSYRNVMKDGKVTYLLHVKGSSEEVGTPTELRYYCDKLHSISTPLWKPAFEPNNLMTSAYQMVLRPEDGSTKYPYHTTVFIVPQNELPFYIVQNDIMGMFSGDTCLGVAIPSPIEKSTWQIEVYSNDMTQSVQFRYYSADKGGIYTFPMSISQNGNFIMVNVEF